MIKYIQDPSLCSDSDEINLQHTVSNCRVYLDWYIITSPKPFVLRQTACRAGDANLLP